MPARGGTGKKKGSFTLLKAASMCRYRANSCESLFCYSPLWGQGEVRRGIFLSPGITFSEAVKQKELSRKDLNKEYCDLVDDK